jgi:signal transduction histidine kinase
MRSPRGLRARLFGGFLAVLLVTVGSVAYTVWQFIEALEVAVIEQGLRERMEEFVAAYRANPADPPPRLSSLRGYLGRAGVAQPIPDWLEVLGPGMHDDIADGGGGYYYVLRQDEDGVRFYLTQNIDPLAKLEAIFLQSSLASVVLGMLLAAAATWVVARMVLGPMVELANRVAVLDPGQRGVRIGEMHADREVMMIARSFDRYLEQLDAFVAREQAFTGDVSHELRTPLSIIVGAVQLLLEDPGMTGEAHERLLRIERAAGHMRELTTAMLLLARDPVNAGREASPLGPLVQEVVKGYEPLAGARGLDLRLAITAPATIAAPHGMATSVIGNIVGNAVEHAGSGVIDVRLDGRELRVCDEGPGIPQGEVVRVFERGYRGAGSRGAGLGLALVRRICDHLGWAVDIDSTLGKGTRITVRF